MEILFLTLQKRPINAILYESVGEDVILSLSPHEAVLYQSIAIVVPVAGQIP